MGHSSILSANNEAIHLMKNGKLSDSILLLSGALGAFRSEATMERNHAEKDNLGFVLSTFHFLENSFHTFPAGSTLDLPTYFHDAFILHRATIDHPCQETCEDVFMSALIFNTALAFHLIGNLAKALELYEEALAILDNKLCENSQGNIARNDLTLYLALCVNIADLMTRMDRYEETRYAQVAFLEVFWFAKQTNQVFPLDEMEGDHRWLACFFSTCALLYNVEIETTLVAAAA